MKKILVPLFVSVGLRFGYCDIKERIISAEANIIRCLNAVLEASSADSRIVYRDIDLDHISKHFKTNGDCVSGVEMLEVDEYLGGDVLDAINSRYFVASKGYDKLLIERLKVLLSVCKVLSDYDSFSVVPLRESKVGIICSVKNPIVMTTGKMFRMLFVVNRGVIVTIYCVNDSKLFEQGNCEGETIDFVKCEPFAYLAEFMLELSRKMFAKEGSKAKSVFNTENQFSVLAEESEQSRKFGELYNDGIMSGVKCCPQKSIKNGNSGAAIDNKVCEGEISNRLVMVCNYILSVANMRIKYSKEYFMRMCFEFKIGADDSETVLRLPRLINELLPFVEDCIGEFQYAKASVCGYDVSGYITGAMELSLDLLDIISRHRVNLELSESVEAKLWAFNYFVSFKPTIEPVFIGFLIYPQIFRYVFNSENMIKSMTLRGLLECAKFFLTITDVLKNGANVSVVDGKIGFSMNVLSSNLFHMFSLERTISLLDGGSFFEFYKIVSSAMLTGDKAKADVKLSIRSLIDEKVSAIDNVKQKYEKFFYNLSNV